MEDVRGLLGTSREKLLHDIESGAFELSDEWLHQRWVTDIPSFAEMLAQEEYEIRRRTIEGGAEEKLRLWTMVFSPAQQAVRLDMGLYAATVLTRKDGNLRLFSWPEPALSIDTDENGGVTGHLGMPAGVRHRPISKNENSWSPIFFLGARKGMD